MMRYPYMAPSPRAMWSYIATNAHLQSATNRQITPVNMCATAIFVPYGQIIISLFQMSVGQYKLEEVTSATCALRLTMQQRYVL